MNILSWFLIPGLICDHGLTLGDLIGVLHDFFSRLGDQPTLHYILAYVQLLVLQYLLKSWFHRKDKACSDIMSNSIYMSF